MKHGLWVKAALLSAILLGGARPAGAAEDLTLRRVMLSTGGVGYFEYEANVAGDTRLPLTVRFDQVDDVLKSVVVYDSKGNLGEITLPGKDLFRELFRDLPFDQQALGSAAALIGTLRGAEVRVELPGRVVSGRIVSVTEETSRQPNGTTITQHRLTLESAGAVQQVILEKAESVKFLDEAVQKQIDVALVALAHQHERGQRTLSIHIPGEGQRAVRVAYIAEAPLWKTTYRLTLPGDVNAKTAKLQGLAVVENRSGKDWKNVDLTLLSGNPVTFRQALYEAYYVARPEIPVDMVRRVLPRLEEGAISAARPVPHRRGAAGFAAREDMNAAMPFAAEAPPLAEISAEESREATTQVVFHMREPVTLADGQSALLPVIGRDLPAERWSLYQPETDQQNPLSTIRLKNSSDTDLPPGALSIYEEPAGGGSLAYVGDARLAPLPAGEERTVSFAVDQRVKINKEEKSSQAITVARIVNGTLSVTRVERQATLYTIAGAAREPRTVVIEQPIRKDWTVTGEEAGSLLPFETTADHLRFRVEVPAGAAVTAKVVLEHPVTEIVGLASLSDDQLSAWISGGELTAGVREAIERVRALRGAVVAAQASLNNLGAEQKRIVDDQARIRENLKAIPAGSDLAKGYLATLAEEETRLHALAAEIKAAEGAVARAKQELATYLGGLNI